MPVPSLVITVAAPTVAELRRRRDAAAALRPDLVELRVDGVEDLDVAGVLHDRTVPVIFTCRAAWEGGQFRGAEEERRRLLDEAIAQGAEYVDLEFRAGFAREIVARTGGKGIVLSSHDFEGVPADVVDRLRVMRSAGAEVVKIAVTARSLSDNLELLQLERGPNTVLIAMGPSGVPTRVLASHFHSCWSYAGDGHAPGQIGASRMLGEFGFRRVTAETAVYGVVGSPLTHSVSPAMHNAAFRAASIDAVYLPLVAASADDFIAFATAIDVKGASITIPFKVDLFQRADDVDLLARQVGAVNTYKRDGAGWAAKNTDVSGFLAPLVDVVNPRGLRTAVIGTGGAARAVVAALAAAGSQVTVYGRSRAKANAVAAIGPAKAAVLPVAARSWDLLVNTTPLGTFPNVDETPFAGPFDGGVVYDLVYNPMETRLLRDAAAAGCRTIGGLDMLVAQAQDQSEWWTGLRPSRELMHEAAVAAL